MINLIERIQSFKAERSLLMSYCVGLPFFEQDILPYLQQSGEGRVTLLLSEGEYQNSFADYVISAGIRYRFNPVRLPNPISSFHPKAYLLLKPREALLLIASANLTPSGFRTNLEIVDELTLSENGQSDRRAFGQFAQMLKSLATLDRRMPQTVKSDLLDMSDTLHRRIGEGEEGQAEPHFLHSIDEPLLPQILRLVPSAGVNEIIAISPFFDEYSKAILELAAAYPNSLVRIIKTSHEDSLAGRPLLRLKDRLVVDEIAPTDGEERRLHAKVLMLRGTGAEWVFSGSANLTRPAWLVAASSGGNVETLVARERASDSNSRLLGGIKTNRLDLHKLSWRAEPSGSDSSDGRLAIIDAYLQNRQIMILVEPGAVARQFHFTVVVEQGAQRAESEPSVQFNEDGPILLKVRFPRQQLQTEFPISATVEARSPDGQVTMARSWVAISSALSLTATQRGVRDSTRQLCERVFADDDAASVVSEAISRFLGELAGISAQPRNITINRVQVAKSEDVLDRQLSVDEFIISDEELGRLRDTATRAIQTLSGLSAVLRRLLIVADETDEELAPADVPVEEAEDQEDYRTKDRESVKAVELLNELTERFQLTVREAMAQTVCVDVAPVILNLPDAVIAYLLLHTRIRQKLLIDPEYQLLSTIRETLQSLLSIEGVLIGTSFGWLVRAMVSDQCRPKIQELLADRSRGAQLSALVAAALVFGGADSAGVTASILGGLHFVGGESPSSELNPELQTQLKKVAAASSGMIPIEQMEKVLRSYSPKDVVVLLSARKSAQASPGNYCHARETGSSISCGKSYMAFPPNTLDQLKRLDRDVICPFCNRIIVPFKQGSVEINRVLTWFDFVLTDTQ